MLKIAIAAVAMLSAAVLPCRAMDYEQAAAIAKAEYPALKIDAKNANYPAMLVARKTPFGMPFSITLPGPMINDPRTPEEIATAEEAFIRQSLSAAVQTLGAN